MLIYAGMISENLTIVRERLGRACARSGRAVEEITLVAVTKGRPCGQVREAIAAGISNIGENRIQEAVVKYNDFMHAERGRSSIKWHMLGNLQSNKVKEAVRIFDLIHSVDSLRLAAEINKQAARINKIQDILLEVKTSPEASKFWLKPVDLDGVIKEVSGLGNIKVRGLMTIASIVDAPEEARPCFRMLKELRDKINQLYGAVLYLPVLSMGMTDDFEIAVEEGSNMVRLGRAVFSTG